MKLNDIEFYIEQHGTAADVAAVMPKIFTRKELARILGITPARVLQLAKRKKNPLPLEPVFDGYSERKVLIAEEERVRDWLKIELKKPEYSQRRMNLPALKKELDRLYRRRNRIFRKYEKILAHF